MRHWLIICVMLWSALAQAQNTVDPVVLKALHQAQAAQAAGNVTRGLQLLSELKPEKNSFAEALVLRNRAYLAWQAGQEKNAATWLQQALATGKLSAEERKEDSLNLGKLRLQLRQPNEALSALKGQPQTSEVLQLQIQAWQLLNRYDQALPLAERYLAGQRQIGDEWLQFMVAGHANLKQYSKAASWQQRVLKRNPNSVAHWKQLAGLQQAAGENVKAFATLRSAYDKQILSDADDLRRLVDLATAAGQPWQGARLLQKMLTAGQLKKTARLQETLASLHWQARERKAAIQLYRELATQGGKADHWLIVAQLSMQEREWDQASIALDSAAAAGASRRSVNSWRDWLESSREAERRAVQG